MEANLLHGNDTELNHTRRAEQDAADAAGEFFARDAEAAFARRENVLDALRRAAPAQRAGMLLHLQMTRGNQFVQQLRNQMQSRTYSKTQQPEAVAHAQHDADVDATAFSFAVTIPRSATIHARDAGPGREEFAVSDIEAEHELFASFDELVEPEDGETVALPDIVPSEAAGLQATDAVAGSLAYEPVMQRGGITLPADDFGYTGFYTPSVVNITVARTSDAYQVNATVRNSIRWDVRADRGPENQINVESESSAVITDENYSDVARDLTPNEADLNGRPRRAEFWARDLSAQHELFHVNEYARHGREGALLARNWLNAQSVSDVTEVHRLLARVPGRVVTNVAASMAYPGNEERAYADGVELYRERAGAIQTRGDNGEYV